MNVLSCFDGISCGQVALNKVGIKPYKYYASEIKKHAIKVTQNHFPNTIQLGDIMKVNWFGLPRIDLLIGGSPCQDISRLKPKGTIHDQKSKLFFQFLRLKEELNPTNFFLENVVGHKESIDLISELLGVQPIRINSSLVSYQQRDRYYWTDIPGITKPEDKIISFQNYKDTNEGYISQFKVNRTPSRESMWGNGINGQCPNVTHRMKINCLTCKQDRRANSGLIQYEDFCRYLTTRELELAQTLPIGYTNGLSYNQACDVLGDCWTVDVIAHIFSFLK